MDERDLVAFCATCIQYVDLVPVRFRSFLYDPNFSLNNLLQLMFQNYEFLLCERCNKGLLANFMRCYHDRCCFCFLCKEDRYFPYGSCMLYDYSFSVCDSPVLRQQHINARCFRACERLKDIYSAINLNDWRFVDKVEYNIKGGLMDEFHIAEYEIAFSAVCLPITFPRTIPRPIKYMITLPNIKAIKFDLNVEKIEYMMRNIKL